MNNPEIRELLLLWAELDDPARRDLLAVARGLVKVVPRAKPIEYRRG